MALVTANSPGSMLVIADTRGRDLVTRPDASAWPPAAADDQAPVRSDQLAAGVPDEPHGAPNAPASADTTGPAWRSPGRSQPTRLTADPLDAVRAREEADATRVREGAGLTRDRVAAEATRVRAGAGLTRVAEDAGVSRVAEVAGVSRVAEVPGARRVSGGADTNRVSEEADTNRVSEEAGTSLVSEEVARS